jgi:hypothetical protein
MKINLLLLCTLVALNVLAQKAKEPNSNSDHQKHEAVSDDYAERVNKGLIPKDTLKGSPVRTAMVTIGNNHVHIVYGSPGVKGRIIWGGLVAYDQVWVTGAHKATSINFSKDVIIADKKIPNGKYALFTIPGKDEWTLILNKNWDQHLADKYSEKEDVLRIKVKPLVTEKATQRLTYSIVKKTDASGTIQVAWEKLSISLPFRNAN